MERMLLDYIEEEWVNQDLKKFEIRCMLWLDFCIIQ